MYFVSLPFAGFFLIVFTGYWLLRRHRQRMLWLLVASCVFYASWKPAESDHSPAGGFVRWYVLLILFSASVDYVAALLMERIAAPHWRRRLLVLSIAVNLGLLAYFKYAVFVLGNLTDAVSFLGLHVRASTLQLVLPLGISFYTFETISYIVDVYRGKTKAVRNLLDYALYIMFFPHLLAGPIVRPADFLPQLQRPKRWNWNRAYLGCRLFLLGLCKKAVLADSLGGIVDATFKEPGQFHSISIWLATFAYAMQVYGDFSGYSDMAIGLAHLFGFKLPANFNMPYFAANIAEFWKRWHISLSTWLRDYLFIPMGGSRGGERQTCRNLIVTMFLGGLWHGANWPSVLWGLYHGVLLAGHRVLTKLGWLEARWLRPFGVPATFLACCFGLAVFRSQNLGDVGVVLRRLFVPTDGRILSGTDIAIAVGGVLAVFVGHAIGTWGGAARGVWGRWSRWEGRVPAPVMGAACAAAFIAALMLLPTDNKLFIYFQF